MLVLSRKQGESIVVPGYDVSITVVEIIGKRIKLGISAPPQIGIRRSELPAIPPRRATAAAAIPR
jgi:carbon storage regulator